MLEAKASLVIRPPHLSVSLNQSTSAEFRASASEVSGICRKADVTESGATDLSYPSVAGST